MLYQPVSLYQQRTNLCSKPQSNVCYAQHSYWQTKYGVEDTGHSARGSFWGK